MADIFISYSRKKDEDKKKAKLLASIFKIKGWSVWWDIKIPPGMSWRVVINEMLRTAKVVVCLWSETSVQSREVEKETDAAEEKVVPVLIENVEIPYQWKGTQAANLVDWQGMPDHLELWELLNAISTRLEKNHEEIDLKAPDIYSKDFLEIVERFKQNEAKLTPKEKKVRLEFYTEYVNRWDELSISEQLEDIKRLNRQYLSDYGVGITQLKQMLREVRLYSGTGNDFPDDLVYAIKTYQKVNDLKPVDGIFGPGTFQSLISKLGLSENSNIGEKQGV